MALKSPRDKYTSPNKNNESDTEEHKAETSQEINENKKKSKSSKKKTSKLRYSPKFTSTPAFAASGQSHRRVPTSLPLLPVIPTAIIPVTTMAPYYPQYGSPNLNYPVTVSDWNHTVPAMHLHSPVYNISFPPVPVVITPQVMAPICPYAGALMTQPILPPVVPQPVIIEELPASTSYDNALTFSPEQTVPVTGDYQVAEEIETVDTEATLYETIQFNPNIDPLEIYLRLPRRLFPTARMLGLDPNPVINELCKIFDIQSHTPWILDLEFGVPRVPITRPIAAYDVKFNSILCKNIPNAIHPGFESCSREFKNALLFYYDSVISSWYRGYTHLNTDGSVESFQSWINPPMQVFGMCWP